MAMSHSLSLLKKTFSSVITLSCFSLLPTFIASAQAGDAVRGESLVGTCIACHNKDGNSQASSFPKIAGLGEKYLYKQLLDIKAGNAGLDGGRPVAQMQGLLQNSSDQDLEDMAAYFDQYKMAISGSVKSQVQLNSGVKVDSLKLGEKVFRAGNLETGVPACAGCHTPRGLGNALAGTPRLSGQWSEYIAAELLEYRNGNRVNDGDSMIMRGVAKNMSDAEIQAVANYLAGLN